MTYEAAAERLRKQEEALADLNAVVEATPQAYGGSQFDDAGNLTIYAKDPARFEGQVRHSTVLEVPYNIDELAETKHRAEAENPGNAAIVDRMSGQVIGFEKRESDASKIQQTAGVCDNDGWLEAGRAIAASTGSKPFDNRNTLPGACTTYSDTSFCSSAFSVRSSDGWHGVLSVAHCGGEHPHPYMTMSWAMAGDPFALVSMSQGIRHTWHYSCSVCVNRAYDWAMFRERYEAAAVRGVVWKHGLNFENVVGWSGVHPDGTDLLIKMAYSGRRTGRPQDWTLACEVHDEVDGGLAYSDANHFSIICTEPSENGNSGSPVWFGHAGNANATAHGILVGAESIGGSELIYVEKIAKILTNGNLQLWLHGNGVG